MPKSSATKVTKKRVKVKELPTKAKTLTAKEAKKIKGGIMTDMLVSGVGDPKKPLSTK